MRVISGKARGKKLHTIEGLDTRPTTDRIKESIFNLIQFDIPDAKVLDLFAGSGALGIEAASRGAEQVKLVENSRKCHAVIEANIDDTNLGEVVSLFKSNVMSILLRLNEKFDVIIMDPPYGKGLVQQVIGVIDAENLLSEDGIIVIEHSIKDVLEEKIGSFVINKHKKYGKTLISVYSYDK